MHNLVLTFFVTFFSLFGQADCPTNKDTRVIGEKKGDLGILKVYFAEVAPEFDQVQVLKFGFGEIKEARIRRTGDKTMEIENIGEGEFMLQLIADGCNVIVGTDSNARGVVIE